MAKQFAPIFTTEEIADAAALYTVSDDYTEVRLGETVFFWKGLTRVRYAPFSSIAWAYMRQEDSRITVCCGKGLYPSFYLMLADRHGKQVKIPIDQERNIRNILSALQERAPAVTIGYTEENAARFLTPAALLLKQ